MKIRPKEGDVYFDVVAVVDPVTRDAQKLAPLLLVGSISSLAGPVDLFDLILPLFYMLFLSCLNCLLEHLCRF